MTTYLFIAGLVVAVTLFATTLFVHPHDTNDDILCFNGTVQVYESTTFSSAVIGESIICARDWYISNIYGPDLDAFDKPLKFNKVTREVEPVP